MQTFLLYRLKAQMHSRGLFLFFIMQVAIAIACYRQQINLTIALIITYIFLPFLLQIIFLKTKKGFSHTVYSTLYTVACNIKARGATLNLYIFFYIIVAFMVLSLVYAKNTVGIFICLFIIIFQLLLVYAILKMFNK
jgi:hypothetical protein